MEMYNNMMEGLKEIMRMSGETFTIKRGESTLTVQGLKSEKDRHITFFPDVDVIRGDVLISVTSGRNYKIIDIDKRVIEGKVARIIAMFETELQRRNIEQSKAPTYNIGSIQGTIVNIGSQLYNASQSVSALHQTDPATKEELERLIAQLSEMLQQVPAEAVEDAEIVSKRVESLASEAGKSKPDREMVAFSVESLKKAATNLAKVMPTILPLAIEIATHIQRLIH
jgi:hypothetical protein